MSIASPAVTPQQRRIQPGFAWADAPPVLRRQDADGDYVLRLLMDLAALLPAV